MKGYDESVRVGRVTWPSVERLARSIKHFHSDATLELMGEGVLSWNEERGTTASWNLAGESDMNNRKEGFIGRISDTAQALLTILTGIHTPEEHWPVAYLQA